MTGVLKHSTVVVVPDDPAFPVGTSEWNAAHDLTGGWSLSQVDFNGNAAAAPAPATGTVLQITGADGNVARVEADGIGQIGAFSIRRGNGTGAALTALASGDQIGGFNFAGYYVTGGPAWSSPQASIQGFATQNWTSTALGTKVVISTTPNGSTALTNVAEFGNDGGTILTPSASASALTLTGGTVTTSQPLINATQTWNAGAVTFTALKLNIAKTAYNTASKFIDLQVDGVTKFSISAATDNTNVVVGGGNTLGGTIMIYGASAGGTVAALTGSTGQPYGLNMGSGSTVSWAASGTLNGTADTYLGRLSAGVFLFGLTDADTNAAIVAQSFRTQGALAGGTSNQAGRDFTFSVSPGKGTGAGGQYIIKTAPAGATGTSVNAFAAGLTVTAPAVNMQPSVVIGNQALATTATDGFLYIASGAGPPTGVPTTFTGRVPLYYDSTNDQLYIYQTAWKQPKTPAGAAIVTWQ